MKLQTVLGPAKVDFPVLTALRGVAAWVIVLYHFRLEIGLDHWRPLQVVIEWGYLAVDLFFIMSGFVIGLTAFAALRVPTSRAVLRFWGFRLARIYPLHLTMLLVMLINPLAIHFLSSAHEIGDRYDPIYFVLSLLLVQNWGFTDFVAWNIPAWSISTEWAAYLSFPIVTWLVCRTVTTAARAVAGVALVLILLAMLSLAFGGLGTHLWSFGLIRCLLEFTVGLLLYQAWLQRSEWNWSGDAVLCAGVVLLVTGASAQIPDGLFAPLGLLLLVLAGVRQGRLTSRLLLHPVFLFLGEISYSTYLVHYFLRDWVKFLLLRPAVPIVIAFSAYVVAVGLASVVMHRWIELPGRALGRRWVMARVEPRRS